MDVVDKIRRDNLNLLLQEAGGGRGAAAEVTRLTGVKAPIISQLRRSTYSSSGKERRMGDTIARKLEKGMGKPDGWMDHTHDITRNESENDFLVTFRLLNEEQKSQLQQLADMFARSHTPPGGEPPEAYKRKRH